MPGRQKLGLEARRHKNTNSLAKRWEGMRSCNTRRQSGEKTQYESLGGNWPKTLWYNTEVTVLTSSLLSAAWHSSFALQGHSTLPSLNTGPVITVCHIPLDTLLVQVGEVSAEDEETLIPAGDPSRCRYNAICSNDLSAFLLKAMYSLYKIKICISEILQN